MKLNTVNSLLKHQRYSITALLFTKRDPFHNLIIQSSCKFYNLFFIHLFYVYHKIMKMVPNDYSAENIKITYHSITNAQNNSMILSHRKTLRVHMFIYTFNQT